MVIFIRNLVDSCDTNAQGAIVQAVLRHHIRDHNEVTLDFTGISNVTSSFVNTAFADLLIDFSFDVFKKFVAINNVNRQTADLIKSRMLTEARRSLVAA